MTEPVVLQERLKYNKNIVNYSVEEMHYLTTALGQAAYNQEVEDEPRPSKKIIKDKRDIYSGLELDDRLNRGLGIIPPKERKFTHAERFPTREEPDPDFRRKDPKDRIKCEMCGKIFNRCNRSTHNKTNYHKIFLQANRKLMRLLQPDSQQDLDEYV